MADETGRQYPMLDLFDWLGTSETMLGIHRRFRASDGVQAAVQGRFPEAIFLPIETTGDGAINVYSRVQMMLYKAKKKCEAELDDALAEGNMDQDQFQVRLAKSRYANPFKRAKHRVAGTAANLAYALS